MRSDATAARPDLPPREEPASSPRPAGRFWFWLLFAGFVLQVVWRLHLSLPLTGPTVHDDEDGYLLAARVLAGGPGATLPSWSIMRPMGYPLLLAPVYVFVQKPAQVYAGVHILNALVTAANFPLLYLLGRRLFGVGQRWAAAVAFVLATLPSLVYFGEFALTDVVLPVLLVLLLLAIHAMLTGGRRALAGVAAGVVAGYAANTHVRGLVLLVLLGVLVAVGRWRHWLSWSTAVSTGIAATATFAVGDAINRWLENQLFPGTGAFQVGPRILERLTSFSGIFRVLGDGLGQIWYLCTSTYGMAGLGMAAVIAMLVRRENPPATRIVLGFALASNVGIALATAAGIPDEGRINNHFYGRYVALFAGLWSLVAIISLTRATRRRSAALIAGAVLIEVGTLGVAWLYAHDRFSHEIFVNFDAPELAFLSHDYHRMHLFTTTALSIIVMVVLVAVFSGRPTVQMWGRTVVSDYRRTAALGLGALLVVNLVAMNSITNWIGLTSDAHQYDPGPVELVRDAHVPPGSSILEASNVPWRVNQRHQREVYWEQLRSFDADGPPPGAPAYVVTLTGWPGAVYGYAVDDMFHESDRLTWVVWRHR